MFFRVKRILRVMWVISEQQKMPCCDGEYKVKINLQGILTLDNHFRRFGAFVTSDLLRLVNSLSPFSCTSSAHDDDPFYTPPFSLRPTTAPHSICSLLRTVSQDTLVFKARFVTRSDLVRVGTLSLIARNSALFSDDTEHGDLTISFQLRWFTFPLAIICCFLLRIVIYGYITFD